MEKGRTRWFSPGAELVGEVLAEEFGLLLPDFVGEVANLTVETVNEAVGIGAVGIAGFEGVFIVGI